MGIRTTYSTRDSVEEAVGEVKSNLQGTDPRMVIYFASSRFDSEALSAAMQGAFAEAAVFGCSTAGEIVSGRMLKGAIVAMACGSDVIADVKVEVLENAGTENRVPELFERFEDYYGTPMSSLDYYKHLGIILIDGLSLAEERIMDKIGDLTKVAFIGASAGDDLKFEKTCVYADGKAYSDAAVLALVKPAGSFSTIKTQSFRSLDRELIATKVDEAQRKVEEFNHMPAAQAYAEALGTTVEEAKNHFMKHPVGLMSGEEPYVRSPQQVQGNDILFYCSIKEGMHLRLLQSTDIVEDTRRALEAKREELGGISGLINFHCILRTLELEDKGQLDAYGELFADIPTVGFSTYGEEYIGHINQTSTMVVFK